MSDFYIRISEKLFVIKYTEFKYAEYDNGGSLFDQPTTLWWDNRPNSNIYFKQYNTRYANDFLDWLNVKKY